MTECLCKDDSAPRRGGGAQNGRKYVHGQSRIIELNDRRLIMNDTRPSCIM